MKKKQLNISEKRIQSQINSNPHFTPPYFQTTLNQTKINSTSYQIEISKIKETCQICDNSYLRITPSHIKTHNKTFEEYKEKYQFTTFGQRIVAQTKNLYGIEYQERSLYIVQRRDTRGYVTVNMNDFNDNKIQQFLDNKISLKQLHSKWEPIHHYLSDAMIRTHHSCKNLTIGNIPKNFSKVLIFDVDIKIKNIVPYSQEHKDIGLTYFSAIKNQLEELSIPIPHIIASGSSYHITTYFDKKIPNAYLIDLGNQVKENLPRINNVDVELRPDGIKSRGYKLPLSRDQFSGRNVIFLDELFNPIEDQYEYYLNIEQVASGKITHNAIEIKNIKSNPIFKPHKRIWMDEEELISIKKSGLKKPGTRHNFFVQWDAYLRTEEYTTEERREELKQIKLNNFSKSTQEEIDKDIEKIVTGKKHYKFKPHPGQNFDYFSFYTEDLKWIRNLSYHGSAILLAIFAQGRRKNNETPFFSCRDLAKELHFSNQTIKEVIEKELIKLDLVTIVSLGSFPKGEATVYASMHYEINRNRNLELRFSQKETMVSAINYLLETYTDIKVPTRNRIHYNSKVETVHHLLKKKALKRTKNFIQLSLLIEAKQKSLCVVEKDSIRGKMREEKEFIYRYFYQNRKRRGNQRE